MINLKPLWEAVIGILLPISSYFILKIIKVIKGWDKNLLFYKGAFILFFNLLNLILWMLSIFLILDAISRCITDKNLLYHLNKFMEKY